MSGSEEKKKSVAKRQPGASACTWGGLMTEGSSLVATAAAALNFLYLASWWDGWATPRYVSPMFLWEQPFISRPLTRGESGGERDSAGNKSRNCFQKGGQKKVNTEEVVSVFMALWKIKAFGLCCWELLWWILGNGVLMDEWCLASAGAWVEGGYNWLHYIDIWPPEVTAPPASGAPTTMFNSLNCLGM